MPERDQYSSVDEELAAIVSSMHDGTPAGDIFATLTERSLKMPQTLASIASNIGLAALNRIEDGSFSWEDFMELELAGKSRDNVARVTILRHEQAGGGSTDMKVIGGIMPKVFDLSRKSLVGAIAELAKGSDGRLLDDISPASPDPDFETANDYLFGENGETNRARLRALLTSNVTVINAQTELSQAYQSALLGQSTTLFPEAVRGQGNTLRSKKTLTEHLRPLLFPPAEVTGASYGLTRHQTGTFIKNITRP